MTATLDPHELNGQSMAYRYCLEFGLVQVPEVIAWADHLILLLENPPDQLIKFALCGSSPANDVAEEMPFFDEACTYDDEFVFRRIIEIMVQKLQSNSLNAATLSYVLLQLAGRHMIEEMVPKNAGLTATWAYDTSDKLDQAKFEKIPDVMNTVQQQLKKWLDHSDRTA